MSTLSDSALVTTLDRALLHQLGRRVAAGEVLSAAELGQYETLRARVVEVPPPARAPRREMPLAEAAALIGVGVRLLQRWCRGGKDYSPKLPATQECRGRRVTYLVDPWRAHEHLLAHGGKRLRGLRAPAEAPPDQPQAVIAPNSSTSSTLEEQLRRLTAEEIRSHPDGARVLAQVVGAIHRLDVAEAEMRRRVPPEDVLALLRSYDAVLKEHLADVGVHAQAARLETWLRLRGGEALLADPSFRPALERELLEGWNAAFVETATVLKDAERQSLAGAKEGA